jgi:hypothetical protein
MIHLLVSLFKDNPWNPVPSFNGLLRRRKSKKALLRNPEGLPLHPPQPPPIPRFSRSRVCGSLTGIRQLRRSRQLPARSPPQFSPASPGACAAVRSVRRFRAARLLGAVFGRRPLSGNRAHCLNACVTANAEHEWHAVLRGGEFLRPAQRAGVCALASGARVNGCRVYSGLSAAGTFSPLPPFLNPPSSGFLRR